MSEQETKPIKMTAKEAALTLKVLPMYNKFITVHYDSIKEKTSVQWEKIFISDQILDKK